MRFNDTETCSHFSEFNFSPSYRKFKILKKYNE